MHGSPELETLGIPVGSAAARAGCAGGILLEAQWRHIAAHRLAELLTIPLSAFIFGTQTKRRLEVTHLLVGSVVKGHGVNVGGCGVARIAGISPSGEPLSRNDCGTADPLACHNQAVSMTEIAGYRVIRQLGAGGMGQVFLV